MAIANSINQQLMLYVSWTLTGHINSLEQYVQHLKTNVLVSYTNYDHTGLKKTTNKDLK